MIRLIIYKNIVMVKKLMKLLNLKVLLVLFQLNHILLIMEVDIYQHIKQLVLIHFSLLLKNSIVKIAFVILINFRKLKLKKMLDIFLQKMTFHLLNR